MEQEHFYLHLSSNVDPVSPLQVGNTIGNFVTHLSRKINLSAEWEVGVTDISYTKSWYNIMNDEYITLQFSDPRYRNKEYKFFALKAGNYNSPNIICDKINQVLEYNLGFFIYELEIESKPRLEYHKESNKVKMVFGTQKDENFYYIHFSPFLASLLGFLDSQGRQYPIDPHEEGHPWNNVRFHLVAENNPTLIAEALISGVEKSDLPIFITKNEKLPNEFSVEQSPSSVNIDASLSVNKDAPLNQTAVNKDASNQAADVNKNTTARQDMANADAKLPTDSSAKLPTDSSAKFPTDSSAKLPVVSSAKLPTDSSAELPTDSSNLAAQGKINPLPFSGAEAVDQISINQREKEPDIDSREQNQPKDRDKRSANKRFKRSVEQPVNQPVLDGFYEVTLNAGINSLYVYCDIIKPTLVGNIEAPLIRRVEIPDDKHFGDTVEINYNSPQYYSLVSEEINHVEIDIKDDSNETIKFTSGRTALTLHFRKKSKNVFESVYQLLR